MPPSSVSKRQCPTTTELIQHYPDGSSTSQPIKLYVENDQLYVQLLEPKCTTAKQSGSDETAILSGVPAEEAELESDDDEEEAADDDADTTSRSSRTRLDWLKARFARVADTAANLLEG